MHAPAAPMSNVTTVHAMLRRGVWALPVYAVLLGVGTLTHQPDPATDFEAYAAYVADGCDADSFEDAYCGEWDSDMEYAEHLIEDLGYEELGKPVKKPLEGIKIAGYVGCQTNRPFGIAGESFENPVYLDNMIEACGAKAVNRYDKKVACCSGALMFSEPDKGHALVKDIIEAAYDGGADMIVTPCQLCQMNVESYQSNINKTFGTKFNIPVVYYSQLIAVAYGKSAKDAALDGQIIRATKLEEIANK